MRTDALADADFLPAEPDAEEDDALTLERLRYDEPYIVLLPCRHIMQAGPHLQGFFDHFTGKCPFCRTRIASIVRVRAGSQKQIAHFSPGRGRSVTPEWSDYDPAQEARLRGEEEQRREAERQRQREELVGWIQIAQNIAPAATATWAPRRIWGALRDDVWYNVRDRTSDAELSRRAIIRMRETLQGFYDEIMGILRAYIPRANLRGAAEAAIAIRRFISDERLLMYLVEHNDVYVFIEDGVRRIRSAGDMVQQSMTNGTPVGLAYPLLRDALAELAQYTNAIIRRIIDID